MSGIVVKILLVLAVLILVAAAVSRLRGRPNRSAQRPERQRMPVLVPIVGGVLGGAGVLLGLSSFTADDREGVLLPMRIASIAIVLAGAAFFVMYRNFYVAPRAEEVAFRTVLGREAVIVYSDIIDYVIKPSGMQLMLTVRTASGPKLRLNLRLYDMTPLLMAIEFRGKTGRWPMRGEALGMSGLG